MKEKKQNGVLKRGSGESSENTAEKIVKKPKKSKLSGAKNNADGDQVNLESATKLNGSTKEENAEKPLTTVDTSIFRFFKEINDEATRSSAILQLMQHLTKTKEADKRQNEINYALKRLVRGCGASTNISRTGFYAGLVALLKVFPDDTISLEQVLETAQKELKVGATISNKEDADAIVGQILVCEALLHAGRTANASNDQLESITNVVLKAIRHRVYHASLGFATIIGLFKTVTREQFEAAIWPHLQKEIIRPWPKQTLPTIHCLMAVNIQFPEIINAKFLKSRFGGSDLLNSQSFQYLYQVFWDRNHMSILTHPAFEMFGVYLAKHSNTHLPEFWREVIEPALAKPTKLIEVETLKIATDIMGNLPKEKASLLVDLLGENFTSMIVEGLKNIKQKKDETMIAFYNEFLSAFVTCFTEISEDAHKLAVIRRLIMPPTGTLNIEKFTKTRIVHQLINLLGEKGVIELFSLYKDLFMASSNVDTNSLSNVDRINAGYMLQHLLSHKAVQNAHEWRGEQLRFLFTYGIFCVSDSGEICKKSEEGEFSKDFGMQCKNMFYTSMQSKMNDLGREKKLLLGIVNFCNERLQQKHFDKYLKVDKFDETLQETWKKMLVAVNAEAASGGSKAKKKSKTEDNDGRKMQLVFHVLLLNMGLHLFREPEMAVPAIDDLLKCMQRIAEPKKGNKKAKDEGTDEEPEWIEVLVDLFLHLLSQNSSALRNIVNALFPQICSSLNLNAVHQILSMLDMKDGNNPLSAKGDNDDDDDDDDNDDKESPAPDDQDDEADDQESDDDDDDDSDEDDEDDDGEEEEDDDEEITDSDRLRNAISQALMANGASVSPDDDATSVDLNDLTEEEGRKLDEALADAFKAMRKGTGSEKQAKKTKVYRTTLTTVMHFRIRVLDLIEIYLQNQPTLLEAVEIMLALFEMVQYCVGDELQPLQAKIEKVINKLTARQTVYTADKDFSEQDVVNFVRSIVEKSVPVAVYQIMNRLRNKCIGFLLLASQKIVNSEKPSAAVLSALLEYMQEFLKSRNPVLNITLISDVFKMSWLGVWDLAEALTEQSLHLDTRTFRRIQACEALTLLYKNYDLQKVSGDKTLKNFKKIEKPIAAHIKKLASTKDDNVKQSQKEYQVLQTLLSAVRLAHKRLGEDSALQSEEIAACLETISKRFSATAKKNQEVESKPEQNGIEQNDDQDESDDSEEESKAPVKRKLSHNKPDMRKRKKQKKMLRLETASAGLEGGFAFAQSKSTDD